MLRQCDASIGTVPVQDGVSVGELGEDVLGLCGPDDGLGVRVVCGATGVDSGLQLGDVGEGATANALVGNPFGSGD